MEKQNLFVNKIDFEEFINFALQLLPLDKEREIEFVAWTALVNKSLSNEDMRKVAHDNLLKNYEGIKQVFKLMVDSGIFKAISVFGQKHEIRINRWNQSIYFFFTAYLLKKR